MSEQTTRVFEDALKLPEADRADLAACLYASLASEPAILTPEWEAESRRRLPQIDSGAATLLSWEEARKRMFGRE